MLKRDELKGPSCLTNAADDEPIFVLKSTDELAPGIVLEWAGQYRSQKLAQPSGMTAKQEAKYHEAVSLAHQMIDWRERNRACELAQGRAAIGEGWIASGT